ncbi:Proteasome subunit beta type-7 [Bagarius yarrelli]|uniref:Proteasome subunit beta type-7 n=1 Tax=Bagarius yarrelli TaxID=175774 RepID=A0A556TKS8_BAGYA|nr:Proteasome subunit beta type-7 [Bagarius yarrelli]
MAAHILQDMLFRYRGMIGAYLILGGVDVTGNHLYTVGPYGSMNKIPYVAMGEHVTSTTQKCIFCCSGAKYIPIYFSGSGYLAAMGILEDRFKANMEIHEAKALVRDAIHSGIMSDLGSGHNIDLCVITKQGVDYIRPYQETEYKDTRKQKYKYKQGTTPVLTENVVRLELELLHETVQTMDTA